MCHMSPMHGSDSLVVAVCSCFKRMVPEPATILVPCSPTKNIQNMLRAASSLSSLQVHPASVFMYLSSWIGRIRLGGDLHPVHLLSEHPPPTTLSSPESSPQQLSKVNCWPSQPGGFGSRSGLSVGHPHNCAVQWSGDCMTLVAQTNDQAT